VPCFPASLAGKQGTRTESLSKNSQLKSEAFNFSNETQKTVLELTFSILKILGSDLTPVLVPCQL